MKAINRNYVHNKFKSTLNSEKVVATQLRNFHSLVCSLNNKRQNAGYRNNSLFLEMCKIWPLTYTKIKVVQAKGAEDNTGPDREAVTRAQR
jgi:hypothetical protein